MGLGRALVGGVVGGAVGSALMWPIYEGAKRAGLLQESPPIRVADRAAQTVAEATEGGGLVEEGEREAAVASVHLLYGAAAGALYGLLQDELELPAVAAGVGYGFALWAVGYVGWMPAARILPEPWRQRAGDALVPVAAHAVYGLGLGLVERAVRRG